MMKDKECLMVAPWMENGNIVEFLKANPWTNPLKLARTTSRSIRFFIEFGHS